ncbi:hypothetical protein Glove_153g43 [Diversispora epigaea]|uniref:Uncharacterized protein n=1 Tax=Diversispora epigaea TaxID=1348612 RepID=A0A397IX40_9GLOM|nr:hypothetical protein Glove_153g43 [Diversispora epigaea]
MSDSFWSLSSNFSLTHNPSSVWSYGSKPVGYLTGTFNLLTHLVQDSNGTGIVAWFEEGASYGNSWLGVYYNPNPTTTTFGSKNIFPAKSVCMHPETDKGFSVVRFTAPTNGNYSLNVTFAHVDNTATNRHTGVYIVYNNLETLWETDLVGIGYSDSFKSIDSGIAVRENETIDFIVGIGSDSLSFYDMTLARVDIRLLVATSTNENTNSTNLMNRNQTLMKVGIIVGSLFILAIFVILGYSCYGHRKNKQTPQKKSGRVRGRS